jgi:hypothetical protein
MTSIKYLYNFLIIAVAAVLTCNTIDPPLALELKLELEDVSCTEAWITLTINNVQLPAEVVLYKNNTAQNNILCYGDTLLYIDSLLPNQTYKFHTTIQSSSHTSNEISVTTMDTTSHNFSWQVFEFGDVGNCVFFDAAIINENSIWVVGDFTVSDSSENGSTMYNAIHWNGSEWVFYRIMFYTICGQQHQNSYPARAIFAIDDETIIAASNSQVAYLKNGVQTKIECIPATINKIWGTHTNNLYVVGNNGNIAKYHNGNWSRIESGTTHNLLDITYSSTTGEIFVYGRSLDNSKSILLKIKNDAVTKIWETGSNDYDPTWAGQIMGIYCNNSDLFIITQKGIYREKIGLNFPAQKLSPTSGWFTYKLTGTISNNLFTAGDRSKIMHYNGQSSAVVYDNISQVSPLYSAVAKDKIIVAVGTKLSSIIYYKAQIIIGKNN